MQGTRRQYRFTSPYRDEQFSKGPVKIGGQDIFIDPKGYTRAVVAELGNREEDVYVSLGIPVSYDRDGRLVERLRGLRSTKGRRRISGAHTIHELQEIVDGLI